jgi:hypothetical protein
MRHITFATPDMSISAERCSYTALKWCESSRIYGPQDIDPEFREFNHDIFKHKRGYGYWLWKPYFIYLELLNMVEGEYMIYTDAGVEFVNDPGWIPCKYYTLFANNYNHKHWCKGDVLAIVGDWEDKYQVQASAMIFKKCEESMKLVKTWLMYCQMPGLIDDSPSEVNHPEFQEHRHDQAILTCLTSDYHYWPAQYNNGDFVYEKIGYVNDEYPIIFHHHRKRNNEW